MKTVIASTDSRNIPLPGGVPRKGKEAAADHLFRHALDGNSRLPVQDGANQVEANSIPESAWKPIDWALARHIESSPSHAEPSTENTENESNEESFGLTGLVVVSEEQARTAGSLASDDNAQVTAFAGNLDLHNRRTPDQPPEETALQVGEQQAGAGSGKEIPATNTLRETSGRPIDPETPIAAELPARHASGKTATPASAERMALEKGRVEDALTETMENPAIDKASKAATRPSATVVGTPASDGPAEIRVVAIQRLEFQAAPPQAGETDVDPSRKSASAEPARQGIPTSAESGRVIQTLKIQIHPAELGPVTARLRLVSEQLSVELTVETMEARQHLSSDSDSIVKALRSLGYDVDRVTVQQAPTGGNAGTGRDGGFQATGGNDGSADGRPRHMPQGPEQDHSGPHGSNSPQDRNDALQGGLYI